MTSGRLALIRSFILFRTIFFLLLCFRVSLEFWCLYEGANILIEWLLSYDWLLLTSCKILVTWNFRWDLVHTSSLTLSTRTLIAGTTNRVYCLLKVTTNWGYWTWLHLKLFLRKKESEYWPFNVSHCHVVYMYPIHYPFLECHIYGNFILNWTVCLQSLYTVLGLQLQGAGLSWDGRSFPFLAVYLTCRNSAGHVYLQFDSMEAAARAQRAMHMRWFARRSILAIFMVIIFNYARFFWLSLVTL